MIKEFNITKAAKFTAEQSGKPYLNYMDTYGKIKEEELIEMDLKGYDLIQQSYHNTHVCFCWEKRKGNELE